MKRHETEDFAKRVKGDSEGKGKVFHEENEGERVSRKVCKGGKSHEFEVFEECEELNVFSFQRVK